ncbi:hypothetical protein [Stenotrophomonas sp. NPDC077659]|uniref:hypothetical protein n=1 Tax=Stenotrophomonas sp. NPDC077659 TaxID=3390694 RepID=UPI003D042783
MLEVLAKAAEATSTELDCSYSRAVLSWAWIKNALLRMAGSNTHDWLSIRHSGNDLIVGVGSVPVRFFIIADHSKPTKRRILCPTEAETVQLCEMGQGSFAGAGFSVDGLPTLWRFIVERAKTDEDESRVFFVGYDAYGSIQAKWQFTESVRMFHSTDAVIPSATELDPISLAPIYGEADNESSVDEVEPAIELIPDLSAATNPNERAAS